MHIRKLMILLLGSVAVATISPGVADAATHWTNNNFTSHHAVAHQPYAQYVSRLSAEEKLRVRRYFNYEQREPCQNYMRPPAGLIRRGCDLFPPSAPVAAAPVIQTERTVTRKTTEDLNVSNVLTSYEIHFDFDRSEIEAPGRETLDQVARDIKKYDLSEVVVAGHADRSGPADYNDALSQRRAEAVSRALRERGIENRILDMRAYGESEPLVPTRDGIPLRENRRVEIQFRK